MINDLSPYVSLTSKMLTSYPKNENKHQLHWLSNPGFRGHIDCGGLTAAFYKGDRVQVSGSTNRQFGFMPKMEVHACYNSFKKWLHQVYKHTKRTSSLHFPPSMPSIFTMLNDYPKIPPHYFYDSNRLSLRQCSGTCEDIQYHERHHSSPRITNHHKVPYGQSGW